MRLPSGCENVKRRSNHSALSFVSEHCSGNSRYFAAFASIHSITGATSLNDVTSSICTMICSVMMMMRGCSGSLNCLQIADAMRKTGLSPRS